jgi:hypothetical protein
VTQPGQEIEVVNMGTIPDDLASPSRGGAGMVRTLGEVTEWLKVRDWKSRGRVNRLVGSNPTLSAQAA